jgi:hypothetical protein
VAAASGGFNYTHLAGAATTVILNAIGATQGSASSPGNVGILGFIGVNAAATSVTIYDGPNSSYPVVFAITTGVGIFLNKPLQLTQGLTVVIAGASADVTIGWL